ncbi:MAG: hypothetical protein J0L59_08755 [Xanthomonadales bacterium]|nr:hypothetical protein [Xanthomonadales bacterium]
MKVPLIACRLTERKDFADTTKAVSESLPYYEREGVGYVHCAKTVSMHYDLRTRKLTHISVGFWCGNHGFLYPGNKPPCRRGGRLPAVMLAEPSPGRVVCATCAGRSIGSGQQGDARVGGHVAKYRPHRPFIPVRARLQPGSAA